MTTLRPQNSGTKRTAARSKIIAGSMLAVAVLLATLEVHGGQLSLCGECESLDGFVPPDESGTHLLQNKDVPLPSSIWV